MLREMFCAKCPERNSLCRLKDYPDVLSNRKLDKKRIQSFLTALKKRMTQDYYTAYLCFFSDFEKRKRREDDRENLPGIRKKIRYIEQYLFAGINMNGQKNDTVTQGKGYLFEVLICEMIRYLLHKDGGNPRYDALLAFPQIDFANLLQDHNQGGDILILYERKPIALVDVTMQRVLDVEKQGVGKFQQSDLIIPVYNVPLGLTDEETGQEICRDFLNPVRLEVCFGSSSMDGLLFSEEVLKTANEMFRNRFVQSILLSHKTSFDSELMSHTGDKKVNPVLQASSNLFIEFVEKLQRVEVLH